MVAAVAAAAYSMRCSRFLDDICDDHSVASASFGCQSVWKMKNVKVARMLGGDKYSV